MARGAPIALAPAPDFAGRGSGASLEHEVRRALEMAHVAVVPSSVAAGRARAAHVHWTHTLVPKEAAAVAKASHWAGCVTFGGGRRRVEVRLIDTTGETAVAQRLAVSRKRVSSTDVEAFARAVGAAVAPPPAAAAAPPSVAPPPPAEAPVPAQPGPPPSAPEVASAAPEASGTEASSPERETRLLRWNVAVGASAGTHKFDLPGVFSYRTAFPYFGPTLDAAIFPLGTPGSWLEGFGLVGTAQLGIVEAEVSGSSQTFTATDFLAELALAYQFAPVDVPFGPRVTVRAGGIVRFFDAPASSGVTDDDRLAPEIALDLEQPLLPHFLRLIGSFGWLPFANQGGAAQQAFGNSTGSGLEWRAGLAGKIYGLLGWQADVLQQRFTDSHAGGGTADDIDTSYRMLLTLQQ